MHACIAFAVIIIRALPISRASRYVSLVRAIPLCCIPDLRMSANSYKRRNSSPCKPEESQVNTLAILCSGRLISWRYLPLICVQRGGPKKYETVQSRLDSHALRQTPKYHFRARAKFNNIAASKKQARQPRVWLPLCIILAERIPFCTDLVSQARLHTSTDLRIGNRS